MFVLCVVQYGQKAKLGQLGQKSTVPVQRKKKSRVSVSCECCVVEASAKGRSLVQRSPTDCGV
jgi:hypothetical protein